MLVREFQCLKIKQVSYIRVKYLFDFLFSVLVILLFFPLWVLIAILIKLTSKGSILFKHKRLGYGGNEFDVYKFRTMVEDANMHTQYFTPEQIAEYTENHKLKNDPRITPLGKFFRETSMDELPQFLNVLKGEMSVIGPRPVTKEELCKYGDLDEILLSVRPGITGLWQVSGRSLTAYNDRVKLDIKYINGISLKLDVYIFLKTFIKVIKRDGAY